MTDMSLVPSSHTNVKAEPRLGGRSNEETPDDINRNHCHTWFW